MDRRDRAWLTDGGITCRGAVLPEHDLPHLAVESEFGITDGQWAELAAGRTTKPGARPRHGTPGGTSTARSSPAPPPSPGHAVADRPAPRHDDSQLRGQQFATAPTATAGVGIGLARWAATISPAAPRAVSIQQTRQAPRLVGTRPP